MTATPSDPTVVTLIPGDGIGPECVDAARRIIEAAGVGITWEECEAGAEVFKKGLPSGVPPETIESISRTRVALKGPLETPVGFGEKSANVTLRKLFETYANVRPVREMPGVTTPYSGRDIDLVMVRENVEDLYAGIEYMQTPGVAQALKLISEKGSEKIARFAFEYARSEGRTKVACATKANIMKLSEGTLKRVFERVAPDYPELESWHVIVDNCAHQLVKRPEQFDVIVTTNMNGDILSDLSSALIGGLGFAPSANVGNDGDSELYLASADWMERNFFRRIEVCFPIERKQHRDRIVEDLQTYLADNTQAWALGPDGNYARVAADNAPAMSAQDTLLRRYADPYD